jgi:uroporphyrinogen-III synthase
MKYFCISESIAYYLQKYIVYRKRKIFFGNGKFASVVDLLKKHADEKFFIPLSDQHKPEIPQLMDTGGYKYSIGILYRTLSSDLSDLANINYDLLVFFSPSGIRSLLKNFPEFQQKEIKIASFGTSTAKAVQEAGLRLDLQAPMPEAPSMAMALDLYIKEHNSNGKSKK